MRFEFFLAKRFLMGQPACRTDRRFGVFRLATSLIAIGGIALGVAALIVTLAVMDGFRIDIQEKILGTQPHIYLTNAYGASLSNDPSVPARLQRLAHVQAVSPYVYGQALLQSGSAVTGIMLRGIDPGAEARVTRLTGILIEGSWESLDRQGVTPPPLSSRPPQAASPQASLRKAPPDWAGGGVERGGGVILGQELARAVSAHVGDTVTLVAPQVKNGSWGQAPRMRPYRVTGIFRCGMYEYDANLAYLSLPSAEDLLGMDRQITGYGVRLDSLEATAAVSRSLQQALGLPFWVRSWQDLDRNLFSAMKLERTTMFLIVTLIILVASFTIVSNLLLLTIEKAREIGILQALGASPPQVGRIFLFNGLMLGGSGVGLGLALGIGLSALLKRYPLIRLPADVYYVDKLPVRLSGHALASVALCAFGLVLVSILYPARKASQMDPVQAIRYG